MEIIKSTKAFALALVLGFGLCLTGCDLFGEDDENEKPTIESLSIGSSTTVVLGLTYNLTGTVKDDAGIKALTIKLTDAAGTEATITPVAGFADQTSWSLGTNSQTVKIPVTIQPGAATLAVTATDTDGESVTENLSLTISIGVPLIPGTVTAGSSGHATLGSSIDLDADMALLAADAAASIADIDLVYLTEGGVDGLYSPAHAKTVVSWGSWDNVTPPTISFMKTSLSAADFDEIINEEQLLELWNAGTATTTTLSCAQGDVFVVETTESVMCIILISAQTPGDKGTILIKSML